MFWYNLRRSGAGDSSTRHAACPVIVGSKWGRILHNLLFVPNLASHGLHLHTLQRYKEDPGSRGKFVPRKVIMGYLLCLQSGRQEERPTRPGCNSISPSSCAFKVVKPSWLVQTSNFSCAEPNVNDLRSLFEIIFIKFGT